MCATLIDYEPYLGSYSLYRHLTYIYMRDGIQNQKITKLIFIHCRFILIILHTPTYTTIPTYFIFKQILPHFQEYYFHLPTKTSKSHMLEIFIPLLHIGAPQMYIPTSTYMIRRLCYNF